MKRKLLTTVILPFLLTGCLTVPSGAERLSDADAIARGAGLYRSRIRTQPFLITAYSRVNEPGKDPHIYIEGDGYAWVTRTRVSGDPTPRRPVALELAAEDPAPNVIYLARPCQYTSTEMDPACEDEAYWTDQRFSGEVMDSMDQAIDKFVKDTQGSGIHLIGYSGGGTVAAVLASRRADVKSLRTVAGNLDLEGFTEHHEVSPMAEGSMDPMSVAGQLKTIPQYHFTGSEDPIVPAFLAENFLEKSGNSPCVHVREIEGVDHVNGWVEAWPELLNLSLYCSE